ncbi:MAG: CYTH domain-containing protein [Tannerella sp.]|jgi:CYTH domain-containing protein|nr:CYTH domain-containing protein [Tannerella sp.]
MGLEIERKFLVKGDFSRQTDASSRMVQGYICTGKDCTVRIRICGEKGFLTIKSAPNKRGWSRYEFEQPVPLADAEELLKLCLPGIIEKVRYRIHAGKHTWEVDVFHGENEGLVVAEIELESEDEVFELPEWAGREVTGDPKYYNAMLSKHPFSRWQQS